LKALAAVAATSQYAAVFTPDVLAQPKEEMKKTEAPQTGFQSQSGLKYFDFESGTGPTPRWGQLVNIQYVSYTISPSGERLVKHDSSYDRGSDGYLIHHGNGEHILGLEEALHSMSAGGRRRAIIPPNLAYSKADLGPVPPANRRRHKFSDALDEAGGTVVMDIELRWIKDYPGDRGYYEDITPTREELLQIWKEQAIKGSMAPRS